MTDVPSYLFPNIVSASVEINYLIYKIIPICSQLFAVYMKPAEYVQWILKISRGKCW